MSQSARSWRRKRRADLGPVGDAKPVLHASALPAHRVPDHPGVADSHTGVPSATRRLTWASRPDRVAPNVPSRCRTSGEFQPSDPRRTADLACWPRPAIMTQRYPLSRACAALSPARRAWLLYRPRRRVVGTVGCEHRGAARSQASVCVKQCGDRHGFDRGEQDSWESGNALSVRVLVTTPSTDLRPVATPMSAARRRTRARSAQTRCPARSRRSSGPRRSTDRCR